jgi:predicted extracellular nuclease
MNACSVKGSSDTIFVAFWNVENLFDPLDDPKKDDAEFLPDGSKEWTWDRFEKKLYNISRVIRSMNENSGPDIIGLCEIENKLVLDSLLEKFLKDKKYQIAHLESPDGRGIDNALIFNPEKFKLIKVSGDTVKLPDNSYSRLIFGVELKMKNGKSLNVFVNHWPSRRGGENETRGNRKIAAKVLREKINKVFNSDGGANILIIGDFNDEAVDESVSEVLKAEKFYCDSTSAITKVNYSGRLFNLSYKLFKEGKGTLKYQDDWNMIDQIIASGSIIYGKDLKYSCDSFEIYNPSFIVTHSGKFKDAPFPTFGGSRYLGGYSDHFPVTAKFLLQGIKK